MNKVLVLGAGLVAGPMIRYLLDQPGFEVTVASRTVSKAQALVGTHRQGRAVAVDANDPAALAGLVQQADLVVSLLPYTLHLTVARQCLAHGKHLVTTSYVKPEMAALHEEACDKGLVFLNEMGLDPGIDHMASKRIIDGVHAAGGVVTSFMSYCGGLPAPDDNTNPLGYKFSWSPRGVLLAGRNPSHFRWDGREIDIPGRELFEHHWPVNVPGLPPLEGYPNRDALSYCQIYGIDPARAMFRGTLRYPGWCETLRAMANLGLLDDAVRPDLAGLTFAQMTARLAHGESCNAEAATAAYLKLPVDSPVLANLRWLGLFGDEPLPAGPNSYLDVMTARMLGLMAYAPGERDLVVLYDVVDAEYADRTERTTSTLIDYGIPNGDTSMARTVSLPAAIGVKLVLTGQLRARGVLTPIIPEIYNPVLDELCDLGIACQEVTTTLGRA